MDCFHKVNIKLASLLVIKQSTFFPFPKIQFHQKTSSQLQGRNGFLSNTLLLHVCFFPTLSATLIVPYPLQSKASIKFIPPFLHLKNQTGLPMEKGAGGGDDSARAVGMCDRFLTFLAKILSMNRQKNITEGPRNGSNQKNHAEEEDEDEFAVKIEKAAFGFSHEEEGHRSFTATILEERSTDVRARDQQEARAEAAGEVAAAEAAAAAAAAQGEKKVRKSVTIKEEAAIDKDKKSQLKKRQASSSSSSGGQQVGAGGGEDPKPPPRWGLRPSMQAILRVPSNINEKASTFIQERKRGFGTGGKPET